MLYNRSTSPGNPQRTCFLFIALVIGFISKSIYLLWGSKHNIYPRNFVGDIALRYTFRLYTLITCQRSTHVIRRRSIVISYYVDDANMKLAIKAPWTIWAA